MRGIEVLSSLSQIRRIKAIELLANKTPIVGNRVAYGSSSNPIVGNRVAYCSSKTQRRPPPPLVVEGEPTDQRGENELPQLQKR